MDTLSARKESEKEWWKGFAVYDGWTPWLKYGTLDVDWKVVASKTIKKKSLGIVVLKGDDETNVRCNALFR